MDLVAKINSYINEAELKLVKISLWSSLDEKDKEDYYTYTDGKGNYPLDGGGGVFIHDKNNETIKKIDGKPHSKSKKVHVAKLNNVFGLYDDNFKLVKKFKDIDDLATTLLEYLEDGKKIPYEFEDFSVGKDYRSDFDDYLPKGTF